MLRLVVFVALVAMVCGETTQVSQFLEKNLSKPEKFEKMMNFERLYLGKYWVYRDQRGKFYKIAFWWLGNTKFIVGNVIGTMNPGALPVNTYVAGCITPPCGLPQGEDAIINIVFRAPRTITSMTTLATAYLSVLGFPVPVPYPLGDNAVTCNFLQNTNCPIQEGEIILYTLNMLIEETFPVGIAPTIEFRIHDDNNVSITCIRVPIIILEPRSRHAPHNATLIVDAN